MRERVARGVPVRAATVTERSPRGVPAPSRSRLGRSRLTLGHQFRGEISLHGFALFVQRVVDRVAQVLLVPNVLGAAMASPAFSFFVLVSCLGQPAAGVGFEIVQDLFRRRVGCDDNVDVDRANVAGQQTPAAMPAYFLNGGEHDLTALLIERVGRLIHGVVFFQLLQGIAGKEWRFRFVMLPIHGTRIFAVQPGAVRGEGYEKRQGSLGHGMTPWSSAITSEPRP